MNYGFLGIFDRHDDPGAAWTLASAAIAKATGCPDECIRTFLESRQGRTFAERVIEELKSTNALKPAIDGAVAKLMHHPISPEDASKYGIQAGLPYLKGFACHCKLEADTGEGWPHYIYPFV
jgi:hypothetical protein